MKYDFLVWYPFYLLGNLLGSSMFLNFWASLWACEMQKKYFKILSFLSFFPHYKLFEEKPAWNEREYSDLSKGVWWRVKIKKKRREQGRKRKSVRVWDFLRPQWEFPEISQNSLGLFPDFQLFTEYLVGPQNVFVIHGMVLEFWTLPNSFVTQI